MARPHTCSAHPGLRLFLQADGSDQWLQTLHDEEFARRAFLTAQNRQSIRASDATSHLCDSSMQASLGMFYQLYHLGGCQLTSSRDKGVTSVDRWRVFPACNGLAPPWQWRQTEATTVRPCCALRQSPQDRSPPPRLPVSWRAGFDAIGSRPLAPAPKAAERSF